MNVFATLEIIIYSLFRWPILRISQFCNHVTNTQRTNCHPFSWLSPFEMNSLCEWSSLSVAVPALCSYLGECTGQWWRCRIQGWVSERSFVVKMAILKWMTKPSAWDYTTDARVTIAKRQLKMIMKMHCRKLFGSNRVGIASRRCTSEPDSKRSNWESCIRSRLIIILVVTWWRNCPHRSLHRSHLSYYHHHHHHPCCDMMMMPRITPIV